MILRRLFLYAFLFVASTLSAQLLPYRYATLPVEVRVQDLLGRMTETEKIDQLRCVLGWQDEDVRVGAFWGTFRADPWTGRTLENGLDPQRAASKANSLQQRTLEETRLGIPLFLAEEAPHGHMAIGTTVFPTGLGLAATFSDSLIHEMGRAIARELRAQGAHISYGPVLDLARDPRWSRTEETLGEDPVLAGRLGAAWVRGLVDGKDEQGRSLAVVPTLKHFIAYGTSLGGQNGGSSEVGRRALLQTYLPPFREALAAGAASVMTAYNAVDGVPCTSDSWLLTDVLRGEWGFRGFVVSDLYSINVLHNTLHTASSLEEAARQALLAGVDMDLGGLAYATLSSQTLSEEVDSAVARILRMKFQLGLFDTPFVDTLQATRIVHSSEHRSLALELARSSIVLLENKGCLPLDKNTRVYVCGPNADDVYAQLGDYTAPQSEGKVCTVLSAMRKRGCLASSINDADVIVAVVGGSSSRYAGTTYQATGAASVSSRQQQNTNVDSGEGLDRSTLDLPAAQLALLDSLHKIGKPLVVIYIEGRPLLKNWAAEHANALLTVFYPGERGGEALVDVLYGDINPAGRLPISQPRSVGQLPVCYDRPRPQAHDYVEGAATPLYPFGYGLSYTSFEYSNLCVNGYNVSFDLSNTGSCDGEEVVQLYVSDEVSSVVLPAKRLRHFARVALKKGESRRVHFTLSQEDFALVDREMNEVVEPGTFRLTLGSSSADIRLETTITVSE